MLKDSKKRMARKLPTIISVNDFDNLMKACKNKETKIAMLLGFQAGMRISEIVGLKSIHGHWKIEPLTPERFDGTSIFISQGKGKKDRIVPRPKQLKTTTSFPLKITRRTLQRQVTQLGKKVLKKHITFHTLRHGFCSHLVNQGRPLHEVQMLAGHTRLDTTGIYLHANPKEAIEKAREVF